MNSVVQSFYNWYSDTIKHPKYRWLIILGTVLYLLSPIDIAPDFIPILGWLDDGLILSLLVSELSGLFLEYSQNRRNQAGDAAKSVSVDNNFPQETTIDVEPIH